MFKSKKRLLSVVSFILQLYYFIPFTSIFFNAFNIKYGACVIPEASQEGGLRSFKNYEDVVMFHFNVPKHVLRATWQFAAFMDNSKCPHRKVNIFLKWGSYPVIFVNNATYPFNMYIENNFTIEATTITTFEPKSNIIIPVYSPMPGDWFIGAYLSYSDEKLYQKGLGLQCQYSLGAVAVWSEINGIENIPLGYQKTIRTTETISYYKIHIPMDTWNFQLDIWGCNFTIKTNSNFNTPCIKNLALKGHVLPFYNHSNVDSTMIGNLTSMDTYTFTELMPFQDSWYYLMVISSSIISFNVKITIFDCPVKTMEEVLNGKYVNALTYSRTFDQLHLKNSKNQSLTWHSVNQNQIKQDFTVESSKQFNVIDENKIDVCIPRYQLVRIKNLQIFSADYLLQGREWLTSWLALTDMQPVIAQFKILPLVDIGGTLSITINLEMDGTMSKQQVDVVICINRGRFLKQTTGLIVCNNKRMMMHLSTFDVLNASLLIPYPQPDTWYIVFQATCYFNSIPVHCEMEKILLSLNIKLRACVFEENSSCGEHGICQEIHKGPLFYTTCKCFKGYQGWGCTDRSKDISEYASLLLSSILVLSNLFFMPSIYLAFKRNLYAEGLIYILTMIFSGLYHACDQQLFTYCLAKFEVLQYCDYFLARLAIWFTLVAIADIPIQYISFCHILGVIIITYGLQSDKSSLINILIPLIIAILIPVYSYGYYCYKMKKISNSRRIIKITLGFSLAGLGILLFAFVETESNYQFVHSSWHMIIALSLVFLLPPVKDNQIKSNKSINELVNYKDSPNNSVFNIVVDQPVGTELRTRDKKESLQTEKNVIGYSGAACICRKEFDRYGKRKRDSGVFSLGI